MYTYSENRRKATIPCSGEDASLETSEGFRTGPPRFLQICSNPWPSTQSQVFTLKHFLSWKNLHQMCTLLYIISKNCKQPKCPQTGKQMRHAHAGYYSSILKEQATTACHQRGSISHVLHQARKLVDSSTLHDSALSALWEDADYKLREQMGPVRTAAAHAGAGPSPSYSYSTSILWLSTKQLHTHTPPQLADQC